MDRVVCIAGKPAPTEKKRQCGAGGCTRSNCGSWLACDGIDWVCLMDRVVCIAGKPAPTEAKHYGAGGGTRSNCGSWLACDGINWVCLMDRVVCIAGKPTPTEKQSTTVLEAGLGQIVGAGLPAVVSTGYA